MNSRGTVEVEFQIVGVRCRTCIAAAIVSEEPELNAFAQSHDGHDLVCIARITAPADLANGQTCELQFLKGTQ